MATTPNSPILQQKKEKIGTQNIQETLIEDSKKINPNILQQISTKNTNQIQNNLNKTWGTKLLSKHNLQTKQTKHTKPNKKNIPQQVYI